MPSTDRAVPWLRRFAVWFLTIQGVGALLWWTVLWLWPPARSPFLAPGAPDATLMSFLVADLVFYIGGSLVSAYGLKVGYHWGWTILCVHAGAAGYGGLYCMMLPVLSGGGWWGAMLMLPSLVLPSFFAWCLRPGS